MHIALCDDNIADRKQFERLLKKDVIAKVLPEDTIFADSYGNAAFLLSNPMQYDLIFLDLCHTPGIDALEIVRTLLDKNISAPIYLCCSLINYRHQISDKRVFFLDKPWHIDDLSAAITTAYEKSTQAVPLIEFRVEEQTYYLHDEEIRYAVKNGMMLDLTLADGRLITILDTVKNFYSQVAGFCVFIRPNKNTIVHARHISRLGLFRILMDDGTYIRISPDNLYHVRKLYRLIQNDSSH